MTQFEPKVAIIVPVFNVACYLEKTLDSCLRQSYHNLEIIVIDDASTDNSSVIAHNFAEQDSRIKLCKHQKNRGTLQARLSGIELATADFALFLDGDDYLDLNAVEELVGFVSTQENYPDIVEFGYEEIRDNGKVIFPKRNVINTVDSELNIFCSTMWNMWGKLFKTSVLKLSVCNIDRGLNLTRSEDLLQYYFVAKLSKTYATFPRALYKYLIRNGFCYSTPVTKAVNDSFTVLNLIKKDMLETGIFNTYVSKYCLNKHLRLASINQRHFSNYLKEPNIKEIELSLLSDNSEALTSTCSVILDFLGMLPDSIQEQSRVFLPVYRLDLVFLSYLKGQGANVHIYFSKRDVERILIKSSSPVSLVVNLRKYSDYSFFVRLKTLGIDLLYKKRYLFRGKRHFINIIVDKIMHRYER